VPPSSTVSPNSAVSAVDVGKDLDEMFERALQQLGELAAEAADSSAPVVVDTTRVIGDAKEEQEQEQEQEQGASAAAELDSAAVRRRRRAQGRRQYMAWVRSERQRLKMLQQHEAQSAAAKQSHALLERSVSTLEHCAERGHTKAAYLMGHLHLIDPTPSDVTPEARKQDEDRALAWLERAGEYPPALYLRGWLLYNRTIHSADTHPSSENTLSQAIELFRRAADAGDADALYSLGHIYHSSSSSSSSSSASASASASACVIVSEGIRYLEAASEQDHPAACYYLAMACFSGEGMPEADRARGLVLLQRAARLQHADALFALGAVYAEGDTSLVQEGVDYVRALRCYREAARLGHIQATVCAGALYYHGLGCVQNRRTAFKYYKVAADAGNPDACKNLAVMYYGGDDGVQADRALAEYYYGLATSTKQASSD